VRGVVEEEDPGIGGPDAVLEPEDGQVRLVLEVSGLAGVCPIEDPPR